ncbi:transporter substrate-binding domain-containing protein [Methanofollis formosanus]|uniref:Transporter substrate-binding domain-containing protein n=1 Tax=Methanofollis formosanus TaxID=299308 RepID=A0A8G0ZZX0_9EURY|nr:transporter substrate-binding domain-containing protein [Methanofollis formosanus]QYZ77919.1 transporter substrate-binding domain-containing protein [Methanofollis formosanus]
MSKSVITALLIGAAVMCACFAGCTGTETPGASSETGADNVPTYIVGIDAPYPPFSLVDKEGKPTGFDTESMEWIAKEQGFKVEFRQIAFDSLVTSLEHGNIDIIYSGMTITPDRAEKINFTHPYWQVNQTVITKADSALTMDNVMAGKATVGTQRGTTAGIWMDEHLVANGTMPKENVKHYDTISLAVTDLENGNIDAVMFDSTVINDVMAGKNLKKIGSIDTQEYFGIGVRKSDTALLNSLNEGLDTLMNDPYWQELITKYNME